jgi:hypothetical protein
MKTVGEKGRGSYKGVKPEFAGQETELSEIGSAADKGIKMEI